MPPPRQHGLRAALVLTLLALTGCARAMGPDGERHRVVRVHTPRCVRATMGRDETQVSSRAFETSCTRQHVGDLLHALDRREGERQLSLATASLVVGAVTGTVAGVWDLLARHATDLPAITQPLARA
ncbi:MAG: hypothetical protein RLZZ450_6943 [Pseudomonadota bacterium]